MASADPHAQAAVAGRREKFLPVTKHALLDRLTHAAAWPNGDHVQARRFMRYLDYWRRHSYTMKLLEIEQTYEPFSPDSDLLHTRKFGAEERQVMQKRLVREISELVEQGNFTRVDPNNVHFILTKDSHYNLDLQVDLRAFEEILIYYRGATTIIERRRDFKKGWIGWKEVKIPVFQRLFLLFKLKPVDVRIREVMEEKKCTRAEAQKEVHRARGLLPATVSSDYIYLKLFKNMPRSDVEMIFPNTRVKFRLFDKIKFGVTAGSGLGMGVFGTATKVAAASNPYTLAGAALGLGGVAMRQASNFVAQRNRYMVVMAQNLYFHAMADNRGVMTLLADRAADEDIKEEILLYSVLAKEQVNIRDLGAVDEAIEKYLGKAFSIDVDFDVEDALRRLKLDGVVIELPDGTLQTLPPHEAALHIDKLWDSCLDDLPDMVVEEGQEIESPGDDKGVSRI
ncbi:MAG TPA: TMEM143 family protein [Hyphomicrobiaceae bacterium]|nr:TMEM143 family protein [Hyphomicrobiaceae bacterium]